MEITWVTLTVMEIKWVTPREEIMQVTPTLMEIASGSCIIEISWDTPTVVETAWAAPPCVEMTSN